jgi:hypothetical protein
VGYRRHGHLRSERYADRIRNDADHPADLTLRAERKPAQSREPVRARAVRGNGSGPAGNADPAACGKSQPHRRRSGH